MIHCQNLLSSINSNIHKTKHGDIIIWKGILKKKTFDASNNISDILANEVFIVSGKWKERPKMPIQ